jgi:hypothetical protein
VRGVSSKKHGMAANSLEGMEIESEFCLQHVCCEFVEERSQCNEIDFSPYIHEHRAGSEIKQGAYTRFSL